MQSWPTKTCMDGRANVAHNEGMVTNTIQIADLRMRRNMVLLCRSHHIPSRMLVFDHTM